MTRRMFLPVNVLALLFIAASAFGQTPAPQQQPQLASLSAAEFSRLVRDLSEDGGFFHSDNFTSNEMSYLNVLDKLRQLNASRSEEHTSELQSPYVISYA